MTNTKRFPPAVHPVPPGLYRCPVCNEYRGYIDIDDQSVHSRCKGDFVTVQCICDGIPCCRCGVNKVYRPISNSWTEEGGFGHWPYFCASMPCSDCRAKQKIEDEERRRVQAAQPFVPTVEVRDSNEEDEAGLLRRWSRPRKNN